MPYVNSLLILLGFEAESCYPAFGFKGRRAFCNFVIVQAPSSSLVMVTIRRYLHTLAHLLA